MFGSPSCRQDFSVAARLFAARLPLPGGPPRGPQQAPAALERAFAPESSDPCHKVGDSIAWWRAILSFQHADGGPPWTARAPTPGPFSTHRCITRIARLIAIHTAPDPGAAAENFPLASRPRASLGPFPQSNGTATRSWLQPQTWLSRWAEGRKQQVQHSAAAAVRASP